MYEFYSVRLKVDFWPKPINRLLAQPSAEAEGLKNLRNSIQNWLKVNNIMILKTVKLKVYVDCI